jgi:hypothetical protein
MKELSGSPTTDVTAKMPWLAKISNGLCQTLDCITKPSQVGLEPSPDAHTAWMMTTMSTIAPTGPLCTILQLWAPGQCQPFLNPCQSPRLTKLVTALSKGDATSSSAANTSTFVRPVAELTQSSNVLKGNHQAATPHILATLLRQAITT